MSDPKKPPEVGFDPTIVGLARAPDAPTAGTDATAIGTPVPFVATQQPSLLLEPGLQVGNFQIRTLRSRGGFAAVYHATSLVDGSSSALKVLHPHLCASPKVLRRFAAEVQIVNQLRHPNIVQVYEAGEVSPGRPYFAMEWLEGKTLGEELRARGALSLDEALPIFRQLADALAVAHSHEVVHRDLKASNVILVQQGEQLVVKLVDFGVAKLLDDDNASAAGASNLTSTGVTLGTPHYMAPEQIRALPVDARADVYAFGVMLFEALTCRLPFEAATSVALCELHLHAAPPHANDLAPMPAAVDAVIQTCLQKAPEARFGSIAAAMNALTSAATGRSRSTVPPKIDSFAIGLHIELRVDCADEQMDDTLFDELDDQVAISLLACQTAGLDVVVNTGTVLLAVAPLPETSIEARFERERIARAAQALGEQLWSRTAAAGRVKTGLTLNVAPARLSSTTGKLSGDLLAFDRWTSHHPGDTLVATPPAIEGFESKLADAAGGAPGKTDVPSFDAEPRPRLVRFV